MARPVYSKDLLTASVSASSGATYEVPPTIVAVIHDVTATFTQNAGDVIELELLVDDSTTFIRWIVPPDYRQTRHWTGRKVLGPGSTLTAQVTTPGGSGSCDVHVSGQELTPT